MGAGKNWLFTVRTTMKFIFIKSLLTIERTMSVAETKENL